MANIWHDKRTFVDENKFSSAKLQQTHPRVHSVKKKQVFGELKNVIHNQLGVTPLKGGLKENQFDTFKSSTAKTRLCIPNDVKKLSVDPIELFDFFDFPKACCTKSCGKSTAEIWSEYNSIDEVALLKAMEKIRNGGPIRDFDEGSNRDIEDFCEPEEDEDSLAKYGKPYLYLEDCINDFTSCSIELPKFDFGNDLLLKC
ncbi:PREDICTED: uncharacterized protein LOC108976906 [Bactrocera latifrons]|uniref:uncharacterized protein LOC108976906 n=1 Tax=Bactrocera latifrons TaxID=174628 RepID=UPI0008DE7305|nr:PREDICTED: uncharacterized protein LOC108976906 [Bactrocera latifrons]